MSTEPVPSDVYFCESCGFQHEKFKLRCVNCMERGSLRPLLVRTGGRTRSTPYVTASEASFEAAPKLLTGVSPVDYVTERGLPLGTGIILGGDPSAGKSTLALQILAAWEHGPAVYIAGEEGKARVFERAARVGLPRKSTIGVLCTESMEEARKCIAEFDPTLVIIDSLQVIASDTLPQAAGGPTQMKYVVKNLCKQVYDEQRTLLMVSQVNKDGTIHGPNYLKHMADVVLFLEGPETSPRKALVLKKTRFGAPGLRARLMMTPRGLVDDTATAPDAETQEKNRREGKRAEAPYGPPSEVVMVAKGRGRRRG